MVSIKGRHTIRAHTPSGREPRLVEPWTFTPKENSTLHRLEKAYLDALEALSWHLSCRRPAAPSSRRRVRQQSGVRSWC
jgi:hypothetical protein